MITIYFLKNGQPKRMGSAVCLEKQGISFRSISDPECLYAQINENVPDIVVLDELSANMDCLQVARRLRNHPEWCRIGIVFISGRRRVEDRIPVIELSDSFLDTRPECGEFLAVIKSVSRRLMPGGTLGGDEKAWVLDVQGMNLYAASGKMIELSYRETMILAELAKDSGKVVEAKRIVETLAEDWLSFEKNRLELSISRLRAKIRKECRQDNPIKAVRNIGYKLVFPVEIN